MKNKATDVLTTVLNQLQQSGVAPSEVSDAVYKLFVAVAVVQCKANSSDRLTIESAEVKVVVEVK